MHPFLSQFDIGSTGEPGAPRHEKPVLATIKLLPLPGSLGFKRLEQLQEIISRAEQEATALASGGVHGLIIENTLDQIPQTPMAAQNLDDRLDPAAVVLMGQVVRRVQQLTGLPVCVSVLPNDPLTALALAAVNGASMVRIPLAVGAKVASDGFLHGKLPSLLSYRQHLGMTQPLFLMIDLSIHHILPGDLAAALSESFQASTPLVNLAELPVPVSHLLRLARYIESQCPPELLSNLVFVVSDLELSLDDLSRLRELLAIPLLVWNQSQASAEASEIPAPIQSYHLASGLILDAGIRKRATNNLLPTVDMIKVESLMNRLHAIKSIEDLQAHDPDFFVGKNPGHPSV